MAFNPDTLRSGVSSVLSSKRRLIWIFRCYCREKPLFSFPSVFGSQIQVFISSDIAQQKHYIRPHKTLQSDSAQSLRDRVLLEDSLRLIQMGIHDYFLVLVLVCERAERREVKFCFLRAALPPSGRVAANPGSGAAKQGTGAKTPDLEPQNKELEQKPRIWSRKTRNWSKNPGSGAAKQGTGAANPGSGAAQARDLEPQNKELEPQAPDREPQAPDLERKPRLWSRKTRNWNTLPRRSWTPVTLKQIFWGVYPLNFIQWCFYLTCFSALLLYFFYWINLRNILFLFI